MQDVIYRIKTAFNAEFEAVHRQKVQELNRARERNRHSRAIMLELDMNEELWEPSLTDSEQPERLLSVDDSEVTDLLMKHLKLLTKVHRKFNKHPELLCCLSVSFVKCEIVCNCLCRRGFFTPHQRDNAPLSYSR